MAVLENLEPKSVFGFFEEMCAIPHGSGNTKAVSDWLVAFARERGLPIRFYSAETLRALPGDFTVSDFVRSVTGVDSVCERAAMVGADRLIWKKTAVDGVTVALAIRNWEAEF